MTVYFIGAGPGAPDLITVRGLNLIKSCPVCLYAGSLVPEAVVAEAPSDGLVMDTASLTLDDIMKLVKKRMIRGKMSLVFIQVTHLYMAPSQNKSDA